MSMFGVTGSKQRILELATNRSKYAASPSTSVRNDICRVRLLYGVLLVVVVEDEKVLLHPDDICRLLFLHRARLHVHVAVDEKVSATSPRAWSALRFWIIGGDEEGQTS